LSADVKGAGLSECHLTMKFNHKSSSNASERFSRRQSPPPKRLSVWDSKMTGNAHFDAFFIASYGRRASRRAAVAVGVAPGARASRALPTTNRYARDGETANDPSAMRQLCVPLTGRRGGVVLGAGSYAGAARRGFVARLVSGVSCGGRGRRAPAVLLLVLLCGADPRAVSLVFPNNCVALWGIR